MNKVNNLNNAISSTKISGNLSVSSQIEFPKDKILNAQFLERKSDGEALIRIGNYNIKAKMPNNVFVRPGDSFRLQVIGKDKDLWNFRFISINRSSIFYKISPDVVNSHLISLKLPITDSSIEIAKALFKYNLAFNSENYKALLPFGSLNSKIFLEAAAFLKSLNLPVNNTNVKIIAEFLNNNQFFSNILYTIYSQLSNINPNPTIMGIIQTFIANIIKDYSKKEGDKIKNLNHLTSKNLKNVVSRLDKIISSLADGAMKTNLEKLNYILKGIGLINSSLQDEKVFFNILPVVINGYPSTVELKIFYYVDKDVMSIDRSRFSFEITVNAPKIGPVIISASVVNNNVSAHIKKSLLPENVFLAKKDLLENLIKQAGFNLGNLLVQYVSDINLEEGINFVT